MQRYTFFSAKEISSNGWMKRQLELQAQGLAGNLDKIWRDVRDSAWIGGTAESWERVPYWLDGFIPLAYLLKDKAMVVRAKAYINAILEHQDEDGWICPCKREDRVNYDTWAVLLISKVLVVYYTCSGDERIPDVLHRLMKNYYDLLHSKEIRLFHWGKQRWFEGFIALNFLKERYEDAWIDELALILKDQGLDYSSFTHRWKTPVFNTNWGETHIVNVAMQLRSEAVSHALLGQEYTDEAERLYQLLKEYNGTAVETFTGDEHLAGLSPIHGTELCAVVELMYSYEILFACTGDGKWVERLETVAFNALPATISDDMWTHQYDQLSNQIACERFYCNPIFGTNNQDAHLFGLEPNFGCCTANFGQGWPKLALSAFMSSGNTVIQALSIPCELKTEDKHITVETDYPFCNCFVYTVEAQVPFTYIIRIPSFAEGLTINGAPVDGGDICVDISADTKTVIEVSFETSLHFRERPNNLYAVQCGSLVFSQPIEYEKKMFEYEADGVERKYPYCDYEYHPTSEWGYAYCNQPLLKELRNVGNVPFSSVSPPIVVKATAVKIDWGYAEGYDLVCAKLPESVKAISPQQVITLYPYGCAKLRMTEMPLLEI